MRIYEKEEHVMELKLCSLTIVSLSVEYTSMKLGNESIILRSGLVSGYSRHNI